MSGRDPARPAAFRGLRPALDPKAQVPDVHPVRAFTESTAVRPVPGRLTVAKRGGFVAACDAALAVACPALPDGRYLFAFRRLFCVLRRIH